MTNSKSRSKASRSGKGLHRDTRGAVLAEFVVVLVPLLTAFFVFTQLSAIAAARLRFKHAAVLAARTAAVLSNANDNCPECQGDGAAQIQQAVTAGLGTMGATRMSGVGVVVTDRSTREDPYGLVTVEVTGNYSCGVPLGKVICGTGGSVVFTERKSLPHQGARYRL